MSYCLPQKEAKKLLAGIADGSFSPDKYAEQASTEARRSYVAQFVGEGEAKEVNTLLEQKMLLKDWQRGMVTAVKKMTGLSTAAKTDLVSKINKMDKMLTPADEKAFYADITEKRLGVGVSIEETKTIADLAKKAQEARDAGTTNLSGVSDDYLKAAGDLRAYIASLKPFSPAVSIGKNAAIIARNNLLLNPSTPVKTTAGQVVNSAVDVITRRLGTFSLKGNDYTLARQANREAWQTFRKTGLNTASMENLDDTGKLGEGRNFEQPTGMLSKNPIVRGVESTVRTVAKYSNKVAIDWEHNITFTKFYQKAFFDMANVLSTKVAKETGGDSAAIFKDAVRIKPETQAGAMVRLESQRNAARITNTNDTPLGALSMAVKKGLNGAAPGLGDALMPIAKIPSNVIYNGIENAGIGIPHGAVEVYRGLMKMQSEDLATKYKGMGEFASGVQRIGRTVGVLSAAAYFASTLTRQDFKTDKYGASFVRIGGVWVNMEYVNAVSPALAGMMEVKKNGKSNDNLEATAGKYISGAAGGLVNVPVYSDINSAVQSLTNPNIAKGINKYMANFFDSRGQPSFVRQLEKGQGVKGLLFSTSGLPTNQELKKLGAK